jgi:hypothetical protein
MEVNGLKQVLPILPSLRRDELERLAGAVKAALGVSGYAAPSAAADDVDSDEALVLGCITEFFSKRGLEFQHPAMLRRNLSRSMPAFCAKLPSLMQFMRRAHGKRGGQRALLCLGLRLLYDSLTRSGWAVDSRVLANSIHLIPSQLIRAYPAGVDYLRLVVDRRPADEAA